MIKIGFYTGNRAEKKELKNKLNDYFSDVNIEAEIIDLRTKTAVLKNIDAEYKDYNIIIQCNDGRVTYYKRNIVNHFKSYCNMTVGWLSMPLDPEKIEEIIFNEDYHSCPAGVYKLITNKIVRAVPYGDISFFRWNGDMTIVYLKDYETEEMRQSIKKVKSQLPERYFVESVKGYIINLYNVKKIDRANNQFIMYSGHKIPISPRKMKSLIRLYMDVMFGI